MTERPKSLTPEMTLRVGVSLANRLAEMGLMDAANIEAGAKDIAKHARRHMDGYQIARNLEKYAHWDCDMQIAEELDNFASLARHEIEDAEKAWAKETNPQPPLPIGTRVKLPHNWTGEITGIYEHGVAKYCVKIDGDKQAEPPTNARRLVNFEDVVAL